MIIMPSPVSIRKNSQYFCRFMNLSFFVIGLVFRNEYWFLAPIIVWGVSVLFGVENSPWIFVYGKIFKGSEELIDRKMFKFTHLLGLILTIIAVVLINLGWSIGWGVAVIMTILTGLGLMGFCSAGKLYSCLTSSSGSCCRFIKK